MPFYRYSATDKTGKQTIGTIEAQNPDDAMLRLVNSGLNVSQLLKAPDQPRTIAPNNPPPVAAQPRVQEARQQVPQQLVQPAPQKKKDVVRTKAASDQDRFLLFSQFSKQIKAGIGPAAALDDLRLRVPRHMSESVVEASKSASEGGAISDTFERYPDLYPESVVGTIRAAEHGGFLEEALALLADQAQEAHAFGRSFWWVKPMVVNSIIALPMTVLLLEAVLKTWDVVDQQGEGATMGSSLGALALSVGKEILWPIGPITILLWAGSFWLYRYLRTYEMRRKRHAISLRWPVFGPRTRHENLAVFSWIMSKLSKSGIAPKRSWELAAASVPNLAMREKLERVGNALSGHEKLSDAIFREQLFPQEYAPIIATAEHTGDMPGAFDQLSKISKSEFETAQTMARQHSGSWGRAGCFAVGGIIMILLFWFLYYELMPAILKGLE